MVSKLGNWFEGFMQWLVLSSADPTKVALTVKGVVALAVPYLMTYLPMLGVKVSLGFSSLPNDIYSSLYFLFVAVGAASTAYGFIRKVVLTLKGN